MNKEFGSQLFRVMTINESFKKRVLNPGTRNEAIKRGYAGDKFSPDDYDRAIMDLIGNATGIKDFAKRYQDIKEKFESNPSLIAVPCGEEYTIRVIQLMGQRSRQILEQQTSKYDECNLDVNQDSSIVYPNISSHP